MQKRVLVVTGGMIAAVLLLLAGPVLAADSSSSFVGAGETGALQRRVAQDLVLKGRQLLKAGRAEEAIKEFNAALECDPAQPDAREGLAAAQAKLGKATAPVAAPGAGAPAADIIRAQASLNVLAESARQMLARGEHDAAVRAYEDVLAAAKPLAGQVDVSAVVADANGGLKLAREAIAAKAAPKPELAIEPVKLDTGSERIADDKAYTAAFDKEMRGISAMMVVPDKILTKPELSAAARASRRKNADPTFQFIGGRGHRDDDDEETKMAIQAKLVTVKVSVNFKNQPFASAIEYIQVVSGVNIIVDSAVRGSTSPVDLYVRNMRLDNVLRHVINTQSGFDYRIRAGAIFISNAAGLAERPVMAVHDVSDLTLTVPDFSVIGKPLGVIPGDRDNSYISSRMGIAKDAAGQVKLDRDRRGEELADFIRKTVQPHTWGGENSVSANTIAYRNGKLVVTHTAEVQEQIRELLSSFRKARAIQVAILARFIEISENFLEDFGINWSGGVTGTGANAADVGFLKNGSVTDILGTITPSHEVGLGTGFVSDSGLNMAIGVVNDTWQANLIINAVRKDNQGNLLTAPRVTCFNTQRAFLTVSTVQSYVRSYNSDGFPEIGQVNDGIILEVQPFVSADRRYITLELIPQVNQVGEFQTFEYRSNVDNTADDDDDTTDVTDVEVIQLPQVTTRQVMTTVSVPDGGTLMIGGLAKAREGRGVATVPFLGDLPLLKHLFTTRRKIDSRANLIILVTAHIIQQDDE